MSRIIANDTCELLDYHTDALDCFKSQTWRKSNLSKMDEVAYLWKLEDVSRFCSLGSLSYIYDLYHFWVSLNVWTV